MSRGGAWSRTARSRQASGLSRAEAVGRSQRAPPQAARETLTAHHVSDAPGNGGVFMCGGGAWSRTGRSRQASGLSRAEAAGRSQRAPPQAARETLTAHHVRDAPGDGGVFMSREGAWSRTARCDGRVFGLGAAKGQIFRVSIDVSAGFRCSILGHPALPPPPGRKRDHRT